MTDDEETEEHEPAEDLPEGLQTEPTELEQMVQQANQMHQQISSMRVWALKQSSDIRAKAEMMEENEIEAEVFGESDPEALHEAADTINQLAVRLGVGDDRYVS